MKTTRVLGLLVPTLFIFSTTFASFEVNLRSGQKGPEVTKLQNFLVQKNLLSTTIFGTFGSLTVKAVKNYQKNNNLPTTGYVGPMTRQIMNADNSGGGRNSSVQNNSVNNSVSTSTGSTGGNQTTQTNQNNTLPTIFSPLQTKLSANNSNVKTGDIIEAELKVTPSMGNSIFTAGATINYDPKVLSLVDSSLDPNWIALTQTEYWSIDVTNGNIVRTAGFTGGFSSTKTFMTYKFKAISSGSAKIYLTNGMALDVNSNDVGVQTQSLIVNIK